MWKIKIRSQQGSHWTQVKNCRNLNDQWQWNLAWISLINYLVTVVIDRKAVQLDITVIKWGEKLRILKTGLEQYFWIGTADHSTTKSETQRWLQGVHRLAAGKSWRREYGNV